MKTINWKALSISLILSLGIGVAAGFLTADSMQQYATLYKPPLSPPGWVFPLVWTVLYILMGIAAYLIYVSDTADAEQKKAVLKTYSVQLFVNFGWSILFFGFQTYFLAFIWLILLWYLIYKMIQGFCEINPAAGYLLLPYLLWVTFAGYLNLAIVLHDYF